MADNFNLRTFLTENRLTKNAQLLKEEVSLNGKPVDIRSIEIDGIDMNDYPDFVDAYIIAADYEDGTPLTDDEVQQFQDENYDLVGELIHDRQLYLEGEEVNEAKGYSFTLTYNDAKYVQKVLDDAGVDAVAKAGTFDDEIIIRAFDGMGLRRAKQALEADHFDIDESVIGVKEKETVKENTMTQRDKYLTRLVENALGLQVTEDDNVDYTMGRHDDPNQLPNPAPELNIPEGDEMADETVIPEYHNIDELMKSIDHGTNEVAEKHKMEQMKKIAEALRMKAKKMEESEHAAHISPKDLKQLATDAAKLEKAAEKLKAAFDKKFNKKEKAPAAPKAEKVEALQEGFDLRKFLIENKLTKDSRILNESEDLQSEYGINEAFYTEKGLKVLKDFAEKVSKEIINTYKGKKGESSANKCTPEKIFNTVKRWGKREETSPTDTVKQWNWKNNTRELGLPANEYR